MYLFIAIILFLLLLPSIFRRIAARKNATNENNEIAKALTLIESAGLTAIADKEASEKEQALDNAVKVLKGAGYKISRKF